MSRALHTFQIEKIDIHCTICRAQGLVTSKKTINLDHIKSWDIKFWKDVWISRLHVNLFRSRYHVRWLLKKSHLYLRFRLKRTLWAEYLRYTWGPPTSTDEFRNYLIASILITSLYVLTDLGWRPGIAGWGSSRLKQPAQTPRTWDILMKMGIESRRIHRPLAS